MSPSHNAGLSPWGAAHRLLMSYVPRHIFGVKRLRDAAEVPLGLGFAPDRLPQDQRGLARRGGLKTQPYPGNRPTVIIHDHGEPGPSRRPGVVEEPAIEQGVIGL